MDNIHVFNGGKAQTEDKKLPHNDYCLTTRTGDEYFATGFLIFTTHHVAVMKDTPDGAIPVLVLPIEVFQAAELYEDDLGDGGSEI